MPQVEASGSLVDKANRVIHCNVVAKICSPQKMKKMVVSLLYQGRSTII